MKHSAPLPLLPATSPSVVLARRLMYDSAEPEAPTVTLPLTKSTIHALAKALFYTTAVADTSFLICAEEFFEDNPLIAATLQLKTQQRYAVALENFRLSPFASSVHDLPLDHRLCFYIQDSFAINTGPANRQEMANLVCMILLMYSSLRGANLGLARRSLSGWRTLQPAKSSAPFTTDIVLATAWYLIHLGHVASITLYVTFFACLRVSEALGLKAEYIAFPGDARLLAYGPDVAGLNIRDAKTARYTGCLQFVKLENPHCIAYLETWIRGTKRTPLVHISYQTYAAQLKIGISTMGIGDVPFSSHSARIGKATEDYIKGLPVAQIALNGRWKSLNSLRYYVNNGRAWLLNTPIPPAAQAMIRQAAADMISLIQHRPHPTNC